MYVNDNGNVFMMIDLVDIRENVNSSDSNQLRLHIYYI
jgi:hypothetical protein